MGSRRLEAAGPARVVDDRRARGGAVVPLDRLAHPQRRRDDVRRRREPVPHRLAIPRPVPRRGLAEDGLPPGQHARVRDDDLRAHERAARERVPVEVHDVAALLALEVEQPRARGLEVVPRILHPLEPQRRVLDAQAERVDVGALRPGRRGAHRREHDVDPAPAQPAREIEAVRPDAARGVGRHEDAPGLFAGFVTSRPPERPARSPGPGAFEDGVVGRIEAAPRGQAACKARSARSQLSPRLGRAGDQVAVEPGHPFVDRDARRPSRERSEAADVRDGVPLVRASRAGS